MKQKRAKAYRKQTAYYQINFKFRQPYQVLIDEEVILEAVRTKFDLVKGLERTLQGEVKPMITQCTILDLYKTKNQDAINLAKSFERRGCKHHRHRSQPKAKEGDDNVEGAEDADDGPKSAFDCIASVVNVNGTNKHRFVVATQKTALRGYFRRIPAVPLIYINRAVMIMEPMSPATLQARHRIEQSKLSQGLNDPRANRQEASDEEDKDEPAKKKRKGPKEPNPLSVRKKAAVSIIEPASATDNKKKRRRRHHGPVQIAEAVAETS